MVLRSTNWCFCFKSTTKTARSFFQYKTSIKRTSKNSNRSKSILRFKSYWWSSKNHAIWLAKNTGHKTFLLLQPFFFTNATKKKFNLNILEITALSNISIAFKKTFRIINLDFRPFAATINEETFKDLENAC